MGKGFFVLGDSLPTGSPPSSLAKDLGFGANGSAWEGAALAVRVTVGRGLSAIKLFYGHLHAYSTTRSDFASTI